MIQNHQLNANSLNELIRNYANVFVKDSDFVVQNIKQIADENIENEYYKMISVDKIELRLIITTELWWFFYFIELNKPHTRTYIEAFLNQVRHYQGSETTMTQRGQWAWKIRKQKPYKGVSTEQE